MADPVGTVSPDMATVPFEKGTFTGGLATIHTPNEHPFVERDEGGETMLTFGCERWDITGVGGGQWPKGTKVEDFQFGLTQNAENLLYEVTYTRLDGVSGSYPATWTQKIGFTDQRFDSNGTVKFPWFMSNSYQSVAGLVASDGDDTLSASVPATMWDRPSFKKKGWLKDASGTKIGRLSKARLRGVFRTWVAITNTAKAIDAKGNLVPARYVIHRLDITWEVGWSDKISRFYLLTDFPDDKSKVSSGKGTGGVKPVTDESAPTAQDGLSQPWAPPIP